MERQLTGLPRELALLLSALQFLTRLPAPGWIGWSDDRLARASRYFPMVGLLLGLVAGAIWCGLAHVLPPAAAAGLALAALLLTTGALHEDGLSDCCDGLGGGRTRERALEIMRDSRIGAYGAAGIVLSLGLRWAALAAMTPGDGALALLVALPAARAAMTLMLWRGRYARAEGAASSAAGATALEAAFAAAAALLAGVAFGGLTGLAAAAAALVLGLLWLTYISGRIGGYTGDALGAGEQIGQIAALLILAGLWT